MSKFFIILLLYLFSIYQSIIPSEINPIEIELNSEITVDLTKEGIYYKLKLEQEILKSNKFIAISTSPENYLKPAFIYASSEENTFPSLDNRNYSSQEIGTNILYLKTDDFINNSYLNFYVYSLENTTITLTTYVNNSILLNQYPEGFRHKLKLSLTKNAEDKIVHIEFNKKFEKNKKVLFFALSENYNYFNMKVKYSTNNYEIKQIFENGYGSIVDISPDMFDESNSKIEINLFASDDNYLNRKIEIGYEIVDNMEDIDEKREINILEHVYGYAENETCYKVKDIENRTATMLINTFTQSVSFRIKNINNSVIYSLSVYNNYFIRLPKEFYVPDNYFCFKHISPKKLEEEIYGEVSYDFQIYYENELKNYQIFIMPLINGKIYTHSLNRGDIIIYRNNFYGDYTNQNETKIYSANMLSIRGKPMLYGFTCTDYPNCEINSEDLKNPNKVEKILPLNMYHINKRLNAEGNLEIEQNGDTVYELRKQYMTIVSCESEENDPNEGECKYNIEINNERDEIQLIPEIVYATSIINPINYFLIRLKDINTIYLKLYFTVLTGNAELYVYTDWKCENELKEYNYSHIHRKEIIEINKNILENYYLIIKCSEPAFIQLKYETNIHHKPYNNLMPNEINIVPISKNFLSYYNMYNPNYYYPLNNEKRNNDFYYKISTIDCSFNRKYEDKSITNIYEYSYYQPKNVLYSYLSTYGFASQINKFSHTSSEEEKCGLIVYNGEISEHKPILISSDMPHTSSLANTYYIYPIVSKKKNAEGIIVEFKIQGNSNEFIKYRVDIELSGKDNYTVGGYLIEDKGFFLNNSINNNQNLIENNLYITIKKLYPEYNYNITTNVINTKISPEFLYPNQAYNFRIRHSSSKYFYFPINKNSEGFIKFDNLPEKIKIYAKIVEKNVVEENYNWNKRVRLPDANDTNLLNETNGIKGLFEYNQTMTEICESGCELYFQVKSEKQSEKIFKYEELIPISFKMKEEKYKESEEEKEEETNSHWWIVIIVIASAIIIVLIIFFLTRKKKRVYSSDIDVKNVNELSMPL